MNIRAQNALGEKKRRIRKLTAVVQKRFNFAQEAVELYTEKITTRRRACCGVLRFVMESGDGNTATRHLAKYQHFFLREENS